jgi:hypothetical protein
MKLFKSNIFILQLIICLTSNLVSSQSTFYRFYSHSDYTGEISNTDDKGFIIVGTSNGDMALTRVDSLGDTLWMKSYDVIDTSLTGYAVQQTENGGFITAGTTGLETFLLKVTSNGEVEWAKKYSTGFYTNEGRVRETFDNGFINVASARTSALGFDTYVIRTNSTGDTLWTRVFGESGFSNEIGYSVVLTTDSGYLILSDKDGGNYTGIIAIKINDSGDTLWTADYESSSGGLTAPSAVTYLDGSFAISSYDGTYLRIMKITPNGNFIWYKTYSLRALTMATDVDTTSNGGVIVTGIISNTSSTSEFDNMLVKLDSSGNIIWSKGFGDAGFNWSNSVRACKDGGYTFISVDSSSHLILTKTDQFGSDGGCHEFNQPYTLDTGTFIKFHAPIMVDNPPGVVVDATISTFSGGQNQIYCSSVGIQMTSSLKRIYVYPNPSHDVFNIDHEIPIGDFSVFNSFGEKVCSTCFHENHIDLSSYPNGIYLFKTIVGNEVSCGLLVKD